MTLDSILEIAIGLVLTWLILSMATMQIREFFVELLNTRARFLEDRLLEMFKSKELRDQFYQHPFIKSLNTKKWAWERKPADIPDPIFAKAAVDIFLNAGKTGAEIPAGTMSMSAMRTSMTDSMAKLKVMDASIAHTVEFLIPNFDLAQEIENAGDEAVKSLKGAEKALVDFRENTESWFNSTMVQATDLYRKRTQTFAFFISLALAVIFNVDSIYIVKQLWLQPTLRDALVAQAQNVSPGDTTNNQAIGNLAQNKLSLPIGWTPENTPAVTDPFGNFILKSFGFIISGAAASLGAPFWFDILNKLLGLKPEQESKKTEREKI